MAFDRIKTNWYRTGETRVVPSWFGFMQAQFIERRDFKDKVTGKVMEYQPEYVVDAMWCQLRKEVKLPWPIRAMFRARRSRQKG